MAPVFRTAITELFGIEHPILLGGMHHLGRSGLVAAVVNAGAMGFIAPRSFGSLPQYRDDLRRCRDLTQGRPFGVTFTTSPRSARDEDVTAWIDIAFEEGVRHFESAGTSPEEFVGRIHDGGGTLIHTCASVDHALAAERLGVDAVALVGSGEGGHPGSNPLPAFVDVAVGLHRLKIPVALGGGIGSGHQVAAALALGAAGVVIDDCFVIASEADDAAREVPRLGAALADAIEPAGAIVARLMRDAARAAYAFARTFGAPARADALRST